MDSAGCDNIHRWLSQVDELPPGRELDAIGPSGQQTQLHTQQGDGANPRASVDNGKSQKERRSLAASNKMYSSRFLSLEPPANMPNPGSRPVTGQSCAYERRPRHRTKPDRYEYKNQKSREEERKSKRREKKSSKLKRKHSMNHNFHASNVPQNRLTLSANLNMGIFQKGKTSSPVKSRELPDLAFSEMKFLSRKPSMAPNELSANAQMQEENIQKVKPPRKRAADYSSRFEKRTIAGPPESIFPNADNAGVSRPATHHSPGRNQDKHFAERPQHGRLSPGFRDHSFDHRHGKVKSKSATPYTWSESRHSEVDPYEICVGNLLPFDLHGCSPNHPHVLSSGDQSYWDLEGLKSLLRKRKRQWVISHNPSTDDGAGSEPRSRRRRRSSHGKRERMRPAHPNPHWADVKADYQKVLEGMPDRWQFAHEKENIVSFGGPDDGEQLANGNLMHHQRSFDEPKHSASISPKSIDKSTNARIDMYHPGNTRPIAPPATSTSVDFANREIFRPPQTLLHLDPIEFEARHTGLTSVTELDGTFQPPCSEMVPEFYENDVSFMKRLDAAYNRIFEAEDPGLTLGRRMPMPEDVIRAPLLDISGARSNAAVPSEVSGEAQPSFRHIYAGNVVLRSNHYESYDRPTSIVPSGDVHLAGRHRSNPLPLTVRQGPAAAGPEGQIFSVDDLPGFWRQNRLY